MDISVIFFCNIVIVKVTYEVTRCPVRRMIILLVMVLHDQACPQDF